MKSTYGLIAVVSVVAFLVGCHRDVGDPAGFRAALECGQGQEEIARLAQRHEAPSIGCPPPSSMPQSSCYVEFGRTGFDLTFNAQGLYEVIPSTRYGLKGLEVETPQPLCTHPPA